MYKPLNCVLTVPQSRVHNPRTDIFAVHKNMRFNISQVVCNTIALKLE